MNNPCRPTHTNTPSPTLPSDDRPGGPDCSSGDAVPRAPLVPNGNDTSLPALPRGHLPPLPPDRVGIWPGWKGGPPQWTVSGVRIPPAVVSLSEQDERVAALLVRLAGTDVEARPLLRSTLSRVMQGYQLQLNMRRVHPAVDRFFAALNGTKRRRPPCELSLGKLDREDAEQMIQTMTGLLDEANKPPEPPLGGRQGRSRTRRPRSSAPPQT